MQTELSSFRALISKLGGITVLARELGLRPNTVKMMHARHSIKPEYWPALIEAATRRGVRLAMEDLVEMRRKGKGERREPSKDKAKAAA